MGRAIDATLIPQCCLVFYYVTERVQIHNFEKEFTRKILFYKFRPTEPPSNEANFSCDFVLCTKKYLSKINKLKRRNYCLIFCRAHTAYYQQSISQFSADYPLYQSKVTSSKYPIQYF